MLNYETFEHGDKIQTPTKIKSKRKFYTSLGLEIRNSPFREYVSGLRLKY